MQFGRLIPLHDLGPGGSQGELVGGVVLEEGEPDHDQEHRHEPEVQVLDQDDPEHDVEQPEQEARGEHPEREPSVATV